MKDKIKTIFCYGDSNTYGYDPRSYLGDRYSQNKRWTGLLREKSGLNIKNCGLPGREIPHFQYEMQKAENLIVNETSPFGFWIMLGTNDLLNGLDRSAKTAASHMKVFLEYLIAQNAFRSGNMHILLISPPRMYPGTWTDDHILSESAQLGIYMESFFHEVLQTAKHYRHQLKFANAGNWDLPMTFDGVHFNEEGHRLFSEKIFHFLHCKPYDNASKEIV